MFSLIVSIAMTSLAAVPAEAQLQAAPPPVSVTPLLGFARNAGQWDGESQFGGRAGRTGASFEPGGLTLWSRTEGGQVPKRLHLLDGRPLGPWTAGAPSPGARAYFLGKDPARWRAHVPAFSSLVCSSLDDRITITALEEPGGLGLEYRIDPSVQASGIPLIELPGASGVALGSGVARLVVADGECTVRLRHMAVVDANGGTRECSGRLDVAPGGALRVAVDRLPPGSTTLMVSTSLEWSSYLGGSDGEFVEAVAWTGNGEVIIGGTTWSGDFPATDGAFEPTANPCGPCVKDYWDAFVARLSGDGSTIVWATYLGGVATDDVKDVHVGPSGEVTVFGDSGSSDFPTTDGVVQPVASILSSPSNGFVTRLSSDGSSLLFSTYFGGLDLDIVEAGSVALDGSALITGYTTSVSLPAVDGPVAGASALSDVFVARLLPDASGVVFSIKLSGAENDSGRDVGILSDGRVVVAGHSGSEDFPFTPGAFQTTAKGSFVATLDGQSGALLASTSHGGADGSDPILAVAIDAFDNIYVAGYTNSEDFPTTPDAYQPAVLSSASDGFVSCFDPSLATLLHSTCFGSVGFDQIQTLHVSPSGLVTVGGWTGSKFLPVTPGAFDTTLGGPSGTSDAFVARLDRDLTTLHYCTYLGGVGTEQLTSGHTVLDVAPDGRVAVALGTNSADFPVTGGAFDTQLDGASDAVVLVMDLLPTGVERVGVSTPGSGGSLHLGVTAMPQVGGETFALHCSGAPPGGQRGLLLLSLAALDRSLTAGGAALWVDPAALITVVPVNSDAYGYVEVPLRMPVDPQAAGVQAAAQFAWQDPGAEPGPWASSHALLITLQP